MKKSLKIIGTFLLLGGISYVAMKIRKNFKNENVISSSENKVEKEVVDEKKEDNKIDIEKDPNNLVVRLFESLDKEPTMYGSDFWDRDLIKECIFLESDRVIHISQSVTEFGKEFLDFYFEIPETTFSEDSYPKFRDYIYCLKNAAKYLSKNIVGYNKDNRNLEPIRRQVGFYVVNFEVEGKKEKYQKLVEIPREHYEDYSTSYSNGLYEYVREVYLNLCNGVRPKVDIEFYDSRISDDDKVERFSIDYVLLMYRISFPIGKDTNDGEIWKTKALKCIEYFTEELKIEGKRKYIEECEYRSIIFHSRDYSLPNEFDLLRYYTTDLEETDENFRRRKLVTKSLEYEGKED